MITCRTPLYQQSRNAFVFKLIIYLILIGTYRFFCNRRERLRIRFKQFRISVIPEEKYWIGEANRCLETQLNKKLNTNIAKNVIFYIGDGMSIPTLMAARTYQGQLEGQSGEDGQLYWETFPFTGLIKVNRNFNNWLINRSIILTELIIRSSNDAAKKGNTEMAKQEINVSISWRKLRSSRLRSMKWSEIKSWKIWD